MLRTMHINAMAKSGSKCKLSESKLPTETCDNASGHGASADMMSAAMLFAVTSCFPFAIICLLRFSLWLFLKRINLPEHVPLFSQMQIFRLSLSKLSVLHAETADKFCIVTVIWITLDW